MVGRRGAAMLAQFVPPTASRRTHSDWVMSSPQASFCAGGISVRRYAHPAFGWSEAVALPGLGAELQGIETMANRTNRADSDKSSSPTSAVAPMLQVLEPRLLLSASLPGLHLVDPTVDQFDGQVIYLDFDGEEDVTYNGPVTVDNIDVPAFAAPGDLAGQEQTIIAHVLDRLDDTFADTGLIFTTERPDTTHPYSSVYVGGDDAAFAAYGGFVSLAEQVDLANGDLADEALIFSDQVGYDGTQDDYVLNLAKSIAHETGHLLGYAHNIEYGAGGLLSEVAAASGYIVSVTQPTYVGGQPSAVTVKVKNTSTTQDYIIDYGSKPSGWSISPGSFNPDINSNSYYYAHFTVTPPTSGGNGTIVWQFKEDGFWSNPILDTYNDWVSSPPGNRSPGMPGTISASNETRTSAKVSWGAASDPDGDSLRYYVEYKKDWSWSWTSAGSTTSRYKTISGLEADTVYDVRVRAYDGELYGSWRDQENVIETLPPNRAPGTPGTITASNETVSSAKVSWGAASDPDGDSLRYYVEYKEDWSWSWISAGSTTSRDKTITGLDPDTVYDVRVRAYDGQLYGGWRDQENVIETLPVVFTHREHSLHGRQRSGWRRVQQPSHCALGRRCELRFGGRDGQDLCR